jgi:hypothetical protein
MELLNAIRVTVVLSVPLVRNPTALRLLLLTISNLKPPRRLKSLLQFLKKRKLS